MAAPLMKCREATKAGADGVVPKENLATTCFGTTPPARPFVELDGLAGTPPNLGGEFKRSPANSFTPSPSAPFRWLRIILLNGAATPPLQGGESAFPSPISFALGNTPFMLRRAALHASSSVVPRRLRRSTQTGTDCRFRCSCRCRG